MTSKPVNLPFDLSQIVDIAHEAGTIIMAVYERDFTVEVKCDKSLITEADLAAHQIIANALKHLTPNIPILSEEDVTAFNGPNKSGNYWLVDPLDGTKEFVNKNGEFTVNIALIHHGESVLGVVFAPAINVTYSAAKGLGAYRQDAYSKILINAIPRYPDKPWRVVGSRSHGDDVINDWLTKLDAYEFIPMGSSLKLCLVAENKADIYPRFSSTCLWDTAAAQCVVEEAGAGVYGLDGKSLSYQNPFVTLNPAFIVCAELPPMPI